MLEVFKKEMAHENNYPMFHHIENRKLIKLRLKKDDGVI